MHSAEDVVLMDSNTVT